MSRMRDSELTREVLSLLSGPGWEVSSLVGCYGPPFASAVVQWWFHARWNWTSQFLSLVPSPPHAPAGIALYGSRVQTGAAGAAGGAGREARLSVSAISQVLGPLRKAPGARDRHARTLFRMLSLVSRSLRDASDALR